MEFTPPSPLSTSPWTTASRRAAGVAPCASPVTLVSHGGFFQHSGYLGGRRNSANDLEIQNIWVSTSNKIQMRLPHYFQRYCIFRSEIWLRVCHGAAGYKCKCIIPSLSHTGVDFATHRGCRSLRKLTVQAARCLVHEKCVQYSMLVARPLPPMNVTDASCQIICPSRSRTRHLKLKPQPRCP